jgi:cytochrome c553
MTARWTLAVAAALLLALGTAAGAEDDLERGKTLYGLCLQCHGEAGQGNPEALAPNIAGLPAWYVEAQLHKFYDGIRGRHPDDIAGMRMRPMALSLKGRDDDMRAVAAYVASLPKIEPEPTLEGGNPEKGQQAYALCMACHGPDGGGNQGLNAPPINHASDWYMLTQLSNFKAGIRGAVPEDASGATMRPMAMTLADEQAMKDVIAYILTLDGSQ